MDEEHKKCIFPAIGGRHDSIENLESFLQKEGFSKNEPKVFTPKTESSPMKLLSLMQAKNEDNELRNSRDNKFWNPVRSSSEEEEEDLPPEEISTPEEDEEESSKFKIKFENNSKYPSKYLKLKN